MVKQQVNMLPKYILLEQLYLAAICGKHIYIYIYISVRNEIHLSNTCIPGKTVIDGQPLKFRQKLNLAHEKRRKQI